LKKVFLSIFLLFSAVLLVACSKEGNLTPAEKDAEAIHTYASDITPPYIESQTLITDKDAPIEMQKLASYGKDPTFFRVDKYYNYDLSGYYLHYKGDAVANSYLQASKLVGSSLNCPNRTGVRSDNAALIECETPEAIIKITIGKVSETNSDVKIDWMIKNE
jgi:hypothetical protein